MAARAGAGAGTSAAAATRGGGSGVDIGKTYRRCPPVAFFDSLRPVETDGSIKAHTAAGRALCCNARILDTITVQDGAPHVWLHTSPDGVVLERRIFDKASIITSWRQNVINVAVNPSQLAAIVWRVDGTVEVLDINQTVELIRDLDKHLPTMVALQRFVQSRGGDRAVYRTVYTHLPEARPTLETIVRQAEFLTPEGAGERPDFPPVPSFHEGVNAALEAAMRRIIKHVETRARVKVTRATLDFVVDASDVVHFMWPREVEIIDAVLPPPPRRGTAAAARTASATAGGEGGSGGDGGPTEWLPPTLDLSTSFTRTAPMSQLEEFTKMLAMETMGGGGERGQVLIADNEPATAVPAVKHLLAQGFTVTLAGDGPKALALSRARPFDCLLLARDLSTLSGLEVARIIRQREANMAGSAGGAATAAALDPSLRLPIIVFTNRTDQGDLQMYRDLGMDGCVSKPVVSEALVRTITAAVPEPVRSRAGLTLAMTPASAMSGSLFGLGGGSPTASAGGSRTMHMPGSPTAPPSALSSLTAGGRMGDTVLPMVHPVHGRGGVAMSSTLSAASAGFVVAGGSAHAVGPVPTSPMRSQGSVGFDLGAGDVKMSDSKLGDSSYGHTTGGATVGRSARRTMGAAGSRLMAGAGASPYEVPLSLPGGSGGMSTGAGVGASSLSRSGFAAVHGGTATRDRRGSAGGGGGAAGTASGGRDIATTAAPVTGGPHGGRIGSGAGMPLHGAGSTSPGKAGIPGAPASGIKPVTTDDVHLGTFRLDAETEIPYCVLGKARPSCSFLHLVVVHDLFDTYERAQHFFKRMTAHLHGLQVLLFNYPGQAFTQFRKDAVLNNEYHAGVLQALLTHVGHTGNRRFELERGVAPYIVVGYGNGGSIASAFVGRYADVHPNLRALVLLNSFITPDAHLAGVLHDCINVFSCTPPTRPDLPVYFFARFLFSAPYLDKIGAPLALNLYTAVANPITLEGRIALCHGALSHANVMPMLNRQEMPVVAVASARDSLVKPSHTAAFAKARGGEVRSIRRTLYSRRGAAVVSLPAGHELFQECKNTVTNLLVQLVTGYHEKNDVAFVAMEEAEIAVLTASADVVAASRAVGALSKSAVGAVSTASTAIKHLLGETGKGGSALLEDRFLTHVVTSMRDPAAVAAFPDNPAATIRGYNAAPDGGSGEEYGAAATLALTDGAIPIVPAGAVPALLPKPSYNPHAADPSVLSKLMPVMRYGEKGMLSLAEASAGAGGAAALAAAAAATAAVVNPRVQAGLDARKMVAPLRRMDGDEARVVSGQLARLHGSVDMSGGPLRVARSLRKVIADRGSAAAGGSGGGGGSKRRDEPAVQEFLKWRVIRNRRRLERLEACAVMIQRAWRQYLARTAVRRVVEHRASLDIQRFWRGCMGRAYAKEVRRIIRAVHAIQRVYRGHRVRLVAARMRAEHAAAAEIQRIWKGYTVRKYVAALKARFREAAIRIQAAWRRFAALKELVRRRIERVAAITMQRLARGFLARKRAARERERFLFARSQAQGIEFGRQLLMEHKMRATKLQSEVGILTREKVETEENIHGVLAEIATFEQGVRALERDMLQLSRADAEIATGLDEAARMELRESKLKLDREFGIMLSKISDRKEQLGLLEGKLQSLERARTAKRDDLKDLERKLVVLLEQQQQELAAIRRRQQVRGEHLIDDAVAAVNAVMTGADPLALTSGKALPALEDAPRGGAGGSSGDAMALATRDPLRSALVAHGGRGGAAGATTDFNDLPMVPGSAGGTLALASRGGGGAGAGGPTPQQRAEAAAMMASTETMMKFGFMAMTMTYFSSMNMVRAMKHVGAANTILAGNPMLSMIANVSASAMAGGDATAPIMGAGAGAGPSRNMTTRAATAFAPALKPGQLPGSADVDVRAWTVADVCSWLDALALSQYKDVFADAAIDGAFLLDLTEEDMQNTLGIEHALHRKKIIAAIIRLQKATAAQEAAAAAEEAAAAAGVIPPSLALPGIPAAAFAATSASPGFVSRSPLRAESGGGAFALGGAGAGAGAGAAAAMPAFTLPPPLALGGMSATTATAGAGGATTLAGMTSLAQREVEKREEAALAAAGRAESGLLKFEELCSWVRHNKIKQLGDALAMLPDTSFDVTTVAVPFAEGVGTQYAAALNGPAFHVNKADERGNTLLLIAAQNNRLKAAQMLIQKGANANHQNAQGNTAMHYAMAYKFHDLAAWVVDPEKGGASDEVRNAYGLDPYEGLEP